MTQTLNSELNVPPGTIDLTSTDDSVVTFRGTNGSFDEYGFAPVVARTVAGHSIPVPQGKTLFISYTAAEVQSAEGIDFTSLQYHSSSRQKGTAASSRSERKADLHWLTRSRGSGERRPH